MSCEPKLPGLDPLQDENESPNYSKKEKSLDLSKKKIYYVTNSENLKQIITSGLIKPRDGYKKYYRDFSALNSDLVPLFLGNVPSKLLEYCQPEENIAVAIIELKLDWNDLKDYVRGYVDVRGESHESSVSEISSVADSPGYFLVERIFSLCEVNAVYFKTKDDLKSFNANQGTIKNFDVKVLKLKTKKKLFEVTTDELTIDSLHNATATPEKEVSSREYSIANSRTALLSYLFSHLPNIDESRQLLKAFVTNESDKQIEMNVLPSALAVLPACFCEKGSGDTDPNEEILPPLLSFLAEIDSNDGLAAATLEVLEGKFRDVGENTRDRFLKRLKTIRDIMTDGASLEGFFSDQRVKSPVVRGFLLFVQYHEALDDPNISENNKDEWGITPEDSLFRELFYATWKGWTRFKERSGDKKTLDFLCRYQTALLNGCVLTCKDIPKSTGNANFWIKKIMGQNTWTKGMSKFAIMVAKTKKLSCLKYTIDGPANALKEMKYGKDDLFRMRLQGAVRIKEDIDQERFKEAMNMSEFGFTNKEKQEFARISK